MLYEVTTIKDDTFRTKTDIQYKLTISQSSKTSPDLETECILGFRRPDLTPPALYVSRANLLASFPAFKMQYQDSNDQAHLLKMFGY